MNIASSPAPHASLLSVLSLTPEVAALLVASYGQKEKTIPIVANGETKLVAVKREKRAKEEKKSTDLVWVVAAPQAAKGQKQDPILFLAAMREAGIRDQELINSETGEIVKIAVFDANVHRGDAKFAVALFAGWTNEPWGTQIDRAMCHARFSILPKGEFYYAYRSPEGHSARWTEAGWIKGAPDSFEKIQQDLAARARLAVEEVATMTSLWEMAGRAADAAGYERRLLKLAKDDPGLAVLVRQRPDLLQTMCAIAEERLAVVREDIRTFDFSDAEAVEQRYATLSMRGLPAFAEQVALLHEMARE